MKTTPTPRPGILCRIVRAWSAITGDPSSGWTARHVGACSCCHDYFAATSGLEDRLRRAAPRQMRPLPDGFEQRLDRVIAGVVREQRVTQRSGSRLVLWGSLAGAAAAVAVAFLFLGRSPAGADDAITPDQLLADSRQMAQTINERLQNDVAPLASSLVQKNPLQEEIGAVYSDAQSALQFLAMNFLPVSARRTPTDNPVSSQSG